MRLFVMCLVWMTTVAYGQTRNVQVDFLSDGQLTIHGTSNVNKFHCSLQRDTSEIIDVKVNVQPTLISFQNAVLSFPVEKFNCSIKAINKDFKKALKYEQFPIMYFTIKHIYMDPASLSDSVQTVRSDISMKIAGVEKEYNIEIEKLSYNNSILTLHGLSSFKMSDFEINPPAALWGLIEVNNEIEVLFDIYLKFSDKQ